jgi:hypothetical protein
VLEYALDDIQKTWRKKGWGIDLGNSESDKLCNLRFADDLLLLATSRRQLQATLEDVGRATKAVGLELHFGKTVILTNIIDEERSGPPKMNIHGNAVPILPLKDGTMYLGRFLTCFESADAELRNRINKGWSKFHVYKKELCGRHYPLFHRLRLFESVVTPTILYGSGSWTMTCTREQLLRTTQRRMLRKIIKVGRLSYPEIDADDVSDDDASKSAASSEDTESEVVIENWVDWIQRATGIAENLANKCRVSDWVRIQRIRKWRWAGHLMRREDGRWSKKVLDWIPTGIRKRGHPKKRWEDAVNDFMKTQVDCKAGDWKLLAYNREEWRSLEELFADYAG